MSSKDFKKDLSKIDATSKAVEELLNSPVENRVHHHHHHKDTTPIFNETIKRNVEKKQQIKQNAKKAQSTKKSGLVSLINDAKRKVNKGHISEDSEQISLLCDEMHFDAKEAYKLLRTNVLFSLPDNDVCRTIGITSAIRGEGKSTVSINLAYTFAVTKARVLLIDMDMRLPSIATKLNISTGKGLSDYLIGNASLKDIIRTTDKYKNWDIMFSGSIPPAPSELIGSDAMEKLIRRLEREYDFIIIDLPPVNIVTDALVAKSLVDGYLLVVRQDYSDKHSLADCLRQLDFIEANVLGFTLTDSNNENHYYRKYGRKYGRYFGRYYKRYGYKKYGYSKYGYSKYGYGYGYGNNNQNSGEQNKQ